MSSRHRCRYTAGTATAAPGSTGWSSIVIRVHFPDPDDSPTRRSPLRVRYAIARDGTGRPAPALHYAHGTQRLTREAWLGFRMAGAVLLADTDREQSVVREVLGDDYSVPRSLTEAMHRARGLAMLLRLPAADVMALERTIAQVNAKGVLAREEWLQFEGLIPDAAADLRHFIGART